MFIEFFLFLLVDWDTMLKNVDIVFVFVEDENCCQLQEWNSD
jgi:hypothetical protein